MLCCGTKHYSSVYRSVCPLPLLPSEDLSTLGQGDVFGPGLVEFSVQPLGYQWSYVCLESLVVGLIMYEMNDVRETYCMFSRLSCDIVDSHGYKVNNQIGTSF